jgi:hypothetical protein
MSDPPCENAQDAGFEKVSARMSLDNNTYLQCDAILLEDNPESRPWVQNDRTIIINAEPPPLTIPMRSVFSRPPHGSIFGRPPPRPDFQTSSPGTRTVARVPNSRLRFFLFCAAPSNASSGTYLRCTNNTEQFATPGHLTPASYFAQPSIAFSASAWGHASIFGRPPSRGWPKTIRYKTF